MGEERNSGRGSEVWPCEGGDMVIYWWLLFEGKRRTRQEGWMGRRRGVCRQFFEKSRSIGMLWREIQATGHDDDEDEDDTAV